MRRLKKILTGALTAFSGVVLFCTIASASEIYISPSGDSSGATDALNIQNAFNKAVGAADTTVINLASGKYYINKRLVVKADNTTIKAPQSAVVTQITPGSGIIRNTPTKGGYDDLKNVTVDGGTWVGNTVASGNGYSGFHFSHAQNITIKNAVLKDNFKGHLIEFAGVKNSSVTNCTLGGKYATDNPDSADEAIQLDVTHSEGLVGNLGADESIYGTVFDDTACENIRITNNTINYSRGIGSHSKIDNHPHKNITISGNKITSTDCGILIYNYYYSEIFSNTITSSSNGITVRTYLNGTCYDANKTGEERNIKDETNYGLQIYQNTFNSCKGRAININGTKEYPIYYLTVKNNNINKTGASSIVLDSAYKTTLTANNVSNSGTLNTSSASSGIVVLNGTHNNISKNTVSYSTENGIRLSGAAFSTITSNTVSSTKKNGLVLQNSSYSATISSNKITSAASIGIRVTGGSYNSVINGNTISKSGERGITTDESAGVEINGNKIDTTVSYGIHVYSNSPNCTVISNKILNSKSNGIQVSSGCSNTRVITNTVSSPKGHGISIYEATNIYVYNNTVTSPKGHGVCVSKAQNASINSNTIKNGKLNGVYFISSPSSGAMLNTISKCKQNGISVYNGTCVLQSNKVNKCKQNGIYLSLSQNSSVVENKLNGNSLRGIRISNKSVGIYIAYNKISGNKSDGIMLDNSNSSLISDNTVSGTVKHNGISVYSCKNSRIVSNSVSGKYLYGVYVSSTAKSNVKSMSAPAADKITAGSSKKSKITGSCEKKCTVKVKIGNKTYKTKKVKKHKGLFKTRKAVKIGKKAKVILIQSDKAKNSFTKQVK